MDNEKAIEKLRAAVDNNLTIDPTSDIGHIIMNISIDGLLAAIQADPLAFVKPKPLVWVDRQVHGEDHRSCKGVTVFTHTSFGKYRVDTFVRGTGVG